MRARIWSLRQQFDKAIADLTEATRLDPTWADGFAGLAWLQATCPIAEYRDGAQAVRNAIIACKLDGWKPPAAFGVLAAAYAKAGDFKAAAKWQRKEIESTDDSDREEELERLELYEAGKPYHKELPQ